VLAQGARPAGDVGGGAPEHPGESGQFRLPGREFTLLPGGDQFGRHMAEPECGAHPVGDLSGVQSQGRADAVRGGGVEGRVGDLCT
jgi:hypothetical protein